MNSANVILNRYKQDFFIDFGSNSFGSLEKLAAGMIAKYGNK